MGWFGFSLMLALNYMGGDDQVVFVFWFFSSLIINIIGEIVKCGLSLLLGT